MANYNFLARKANRHLLLSYLPNVSIEKDYVPLHLLPACSYKPLTKTIISWGFFHRDILLRKTWENLEPLASSHNNSGNGNGCGITTCRNYSEVRSLYIKR